MTTSERGPERGVVKGGKPWRGSRVVQLFLRCPNCKWVRWEWVYWREFPKYLTCEKCQRVIPTPAWVVIGYEYLGEEKRILAQEAYLEQWKGVG